MKKKKEKEKKLKLKEKKRGEKRARERERSRSEKRERGKVCRNLKQPPSREARKRELTEGSKKTEASYS